MSEPGGDKPDTPETRLAHLGSRREWTSIPGQRGGVVNPPAWRASTILYDDVAHLRSARGNMHERWYYGRKGTPTHWALADALTELEPGAAGTMLYPSGVAAITNTLMALLKPGDQLLMVDSVYDPTRSFCDKVLKQLGIETVYYDPLIGGGIEALVNERTKVIFLESPGSLTFEVQDIPAIVAVAKQHDIVTVLDNTWATPLLFSALAHGVDISIVACTKYIVGHSDVMLGSATANDALWPRIQNGAWTFGQICGPDDAWLALRGLRTLAVRLKQHQETALAIARWLSEHSEVGTVLHPALPSCPGHEAWARDFKGSSGLFSFTLKNADDAARVKFIDALRLFGIGYSWGGYESLALPVDPQTCRSATKWGTQDPLIRLHIGLEGTEDLIADIEHAFDKIS
ncbi:MAG: cystathionine beta-lyase [Sphingomonadaceae bacterium]|jgi:cystathionine beta-lyase